MKLLIGLGNPGLQYQNTRHNAGFLVLEKLLDQKGGVWGNEAKGNALVSQITIGSEEVVLALPQAYMNLSGNVVRELMRWYKVDVSDIVVVYDELDLMFGRIQVRRGGGAAGHNGVKSIIERVGEEFTRVRIGIGRPEGQQPADVYVLESFTAAEKKKFASVADEVIEKITLLITHGYEQFMSKYNS